ncbi:hypothetical protein MKX03_013850, partial [Papaver bracteatum]
IAGKLREYVLEELNVRSIVPCNDPLKYASLRAEPDFSVLGKRLGKFMRIVKDKVQAMTQADILSFESVGEVTIDGHCLKLTDIKVVRVFKRPENMGEKEMDATGDGDVLVILDLCPDKSLFEAGVAPEIVNRIQKLRKKAGLEPTDMVEVYYESLDDDKSLQNVVNLQESYIRDALGSPLLPWDTAQPHTAVIREETFHDISGLAFVIRLAKQTLSCSS